MTSNLYRVLAGVGLLFALRPSAAVAQQGTTVTGRVTNEASLPVQGVSVSIARLQVGAYTDAEGRYAFTVPASAAGQTVTIVARRIGYQPKSATATISGASVTQDFVLTTAPTQLEGVVVSALGQTRQRSQLGTAQQQLTTTDLNQTRALNVIDQVSGKISGVQITGSGTQGGSSNIVIRGQNSITGNNQPLFIIDGVPLTNAEPRAGNGIGGSPNGGYDFGSAISDLNPDDIETFTVLKGPNAAALYGSRAANGVIIITTKKGAQAGGGVRTDLTTFYTWERPSILPSYQNQYGQGAQGEFAFVDGAGGGVNDNLDQSFGPKLDGRTSGCVFKPGVVKAAPSLEALTPADYDSSQPCLQFNVPAGAPWVAHPNNVSSFFNTGHTASATLAVSGGTDRANARLSLGGENTDGIVPNNYFHKISGLLTGGIQVNKKLSTNATLQYLRNSARNRPGTGYNVGILEQFIWFGRQVDMNSLKNGYNQPGTVNGGPATREYNWNYSYHNNPYWLQYDNPLNDSRDRFIGSVSANYQATDWLTASLRTGSDISRFNVDQDYAQGNLNFSDPSYYGGFNFYDEYRNENNTEGLLTANRNVTSRLQLTGNLGGNIRHESYNNGQTYTSGISVGGIYNVSNAAITPTLTQYDERRQVNSVFGSLGYTWDGWWTLEGTARNDWSSTLPKGNNSYFYPSVNTSLVLTDAIPSLKNDVLSYLKLRGSIAKVGNDAPPYRLATTFVGNPNKFGGLPQFSFDNVIANPQLKPEITRAAEGGVELGFFNGRASLDATYYGKSTLNQIINITVAPSSGFGSKYINAGRIDNKGVEALLTVIPVQSAGGLNWTSTFNFSKNRSKVVDLAPGIKTIVIGTSWYTNIEARQGEPYGAIYGYAFARDSAGNLLTSGGLTQVGGRKVLGNIQPDWIGGWNNQFNYKNWSLGVLFDGRFGGDIVSISNFFGDYAGITKESLKGREVDWNNPGIVVKGIDEDTGKPNTTTVTSEEYFQNIFPVMEPYVYKATWVKLRELRVGYDLPTKWANRIDAEQVNIALTGRNLITWTDVPNIDPEFSYTTNNFQGIEFAALPNPRTIGVSVRITP